MSPDTLPLDELLGHLDSLDLRGAMELVHACADDHGVDATVVGLLAAAQHEVGRRWAFGEWTVAQEHAATAIVDAAIAQLHLWVDEHAPRTGPHMALVCAEGEWHVTPARMAALRLLDRGWHVTFLGASTPSDHLARTLGALRPDVVGVSCTMSVHLPGVRRVAAVAHAEGLPVVAGGAALGEGRARAEAIGVDAGGTDVDDVDVAARRLLDRWVAHDLSLAEPGPERQADHAAYELVVSAALADLATAPGAAWADDPRARDRVRDDLRWILRFLEAARDVADPSVFRDFLDWLQGVLIVHGVPVAALTAGLDRLAHHVGAEDEDARRLLHAGAAWIEQGEWPA